MNKASANKTHPMVITAAAAVTLFSIVGSAAVAGLIPSAQSADAATAQPAPAVTPSQEKPSTEKPFKSVVSGQADESPATGHATRHRPSAKSSDKVTKSAACKVCGVIESINTVEHDGEGSGLGAVAGGVVGGVAGNQMGKGKGNTLLTIIGLGGGAYAGHEIEKKMKSSTAYVVKVRMEDGSYRKVTQSQPPEYAVGDHVRVVSGSITST